MREWSTLDLFDPSLTLSDQHAPPPLCPFKTRRKMLSAWKNFMHPREKLCWYYREGSSRDVAALGIKGSNLCEVFRMGLPTPAGFIISAEASKVKKQATHTTTP
jgi:hypothetical protein